MPDYEAEGLLKGLSGEEREARLALLGELHENRGVSIEDLRRAVEENRLAFLPSELLLGGPARYTGKELAEKAGVDFDFLSSMRRANGLPALEPGERAFTDTDLAITENIRAFRDLGLPKEDMVEVTRALGHGFAQAADAMRTMVLKLALEPGSSERDLALRSADIASQLLPLTGPMLSQMLALHLRHMAQTEAVGAAERESGRLPGARDMNIAFADLVGFTRMGEEVPADELGRVAARLTELADEVARPPVRVVKTIGDAAMLASPAPGELLDSGLALVEAADGEGQEFPQLRVGMASGPALSRAGDLYGRPVNLASRITGVARPGSVLVTRDVRDAVRESAGDRFAWSYAGPKRLKGVRDPVPVYRARWLDDVRGASDASGASHSNGASDPNPSDRNEPDRQGS
jgi:adenylate cyclase